MRCFSSPPLAELPLFSLRQSSGSVSYVRRRNYFRPCTVNARRFAVVILAGKYRTPQPYEDLAKGYARSLQREEAQLATTIPPVIALVEILEGFCLIAALALQLAPILYATTLQRRQSQPSISGAEIREESSEAEGQTAVSTVAEVAPVQVEMSWDASQCSVWSVWALTAAVLLGSFLRRFHRHRTDLRQELLPNSPSVLSSLDHQEMENDVARAFGEISQMASQVDKLRIKIRLISKDYGAAVENSNTHSMQLKQALHEVVGQIKGTEERMTELHDIVVKIEGFQSKQFTVVSAALRRLDQECKSLTAELPQSPPETEPMLETEPVKERPATSELDLQS